MSATKTIYKMKVLKIIDHTKIIRELVLAPLSPEIFSFKAGQFVMLHVPQAEGKPALRAYSIASTEENKKGFNLIFKYVDNGIASKFVWNLQGNEELEMTGPFGRLYFKEPPTDQIVFLNTGSGLSQHYCYLTSKMKQYPNLRYHLLFGLRNEQDIYYKDQLEELKKSLPHFNYEFVLSQATDSWAGKKGYLQNFLGEFNINNIDTTFYLCGNGEMIKAVKAKLEAEGFDKSKILAESFD